MRTRHTRKRGQTEPIVYREMSAGGEPTVYQLVEHVCNASLTFGPVSSVAQSCPDGFPPSHGYSSSHPGASPVTLLVPGDQEPDRCLVLDVLTAETVGGAAPTLLADRADYGVGHDSARSANAGFGRHTFALRLPVKSRAHGQALHLKFDGNGLRVLDYRHRRGQHKNGNAQQKKDNSPLWSHFTNPSNES